MGLTMSYTDIGNHLHRLIKLAMDNGEVESLEAGEQLFKSYQLLIEVGPNVATSPTLQAALLTVVNAGRRCFLGGVFVKGNLNVPLLVPWGHLQTLDAAVYDLGGSTTQEAKATVPYIAIGTTSESLPANEFAVRATFDGWAGGIIPLRDMFQLAEIQEFTPAGVLAGAIAVSEAFQFIRGGNPETGRRKVGLSLWQPEITDWWLGGQAGPTLELLPAKLWLIGLGHLGQAYLWTLGFLPYSQPEDVSLVLQDFDTLMPANDSTSPLTTSKSVGVKKTRQMAHWAEQRGFRTTIIERPFDNDFRLNSDDPRVALCGVDNRLARASLEDIGFQRIIEAGLGRGREYLAFQLHTFPAERSARARWGTPKRVEIPNVIANQPAYQALTLRGLDQCGLTLLANRTVGASFVGLTVSTLVIAELLRMVLGVHQYEVIDGTLRSLNHRQAILTASQQVAYNPGYTMASRYTQ